MSEDIEKIRAEKIAALQAKMKKADEQNEEITAMKQEFTWADFGYEEPPFGFRES
jgi:DNA-binding TFAR19-related protein (PDSD5 family)